MTRNFVFALALVAVACGGKDTVASKSAAAYREEQTTQATATAPAPMDHSAHGTAPADAHAGHDMPAMDHTAHTTSAMDHSKMDHGKMDHGKMDHGKMDHSAMGHTSAAATDHSAHGATTPQPSMDHAQHSMTAAPPAPVLPAAPRSNAEMQAVNPSSTLQSDAFDAPSPISVSEARKQ